MIQEIKATREPAEDLEVTKKNEAKAILIFFTSSNKSGGCM
jgi:hypothetical protein